eukprot:jgi/Psemu1/250348/estExt_Genewise1Plus.C_150103
MGDAKEEELLSTLIPDSDVFCYIITMYSKSSIPNAAERADHWLQKMIQASELYPDRVVSPRASIFANVLSAWEKSRLPGGDSNKAEKFLQDMHLSYTEGNDALKPNTETFNAVIQSWLRSGSPMAAWRADGIFKRMNELSETGKLDVKPNSRTFDLVISTLAQDWGAELGKVDLYLALLKEHYRAGDCVPTATSYTEAIRAWASKDDDPRAILRAQALLDEMHELAREGVDTVRPNRSTYEVYLEGLCQSSVENRVPLVSDVLLKMRENKFDLDNAMRSSIQRCLLPVSSRVNTWIIDVDEYINPQNEWMNSAKYSSDSL